VATGRYTDSSAVLATPRRSMSWWLVAFRPGCIRRCCGERCLPSPVGLRASPETVFWLVELRVELRGLEPLTPTLPGAGRGADQAR
jgi:hypothetical protein